MRTAVPLASAACASATLMRRAPSSGCSSLIGVICTFSAGGCGAGVAGGCWAASAAGSSTSAATPSVLRSMRKPPGEAGPAVAAGSGPLILRSLPQDLARQGGDREGGAPLGVVVDRAQEGAPRRQRLAGQGGD